MLFSLQHKLLNEYEEGSDLGGSDDPEAPEPQPWDVSLGEMRESLTAMEGRFGERLSPIQQQMQGIQAALGKQTAVEVPDELVHKIEALFSSYDPKFEGVGEMLKELLTSSVKQRDLSPEALQPLLDPILSERDYRHAERWLDAVQPTFTFDMAEFDKEGWHEKPTSETHKLFLKWWDRADTATRNALTARRQDGSVADPYAYGKAFKAFDGFYRSQTRQASESVGASAARLAGAVQTRSSGRASPGGSQLRTEADGFASVFKQAS
jgi:hypothetical protein